MNLCVLTHIHVQKCQMNALKFNNTFIKFRTASRMKKKTFSLLFFEYKRILSIKSPPGKSIQFSRIHVSSAPVLSAMREFISPNRIHFEIFVFPYTFFPFIRFDCGRRRFEIFYFTLIRWQESIGTKKNISKKLNPIPNEPPE